MNNSLTHVGVKGMRWGVIRDRSSLTVNSGNDNYEERYNKLNAETTRVLKKGGTVRHITVDPKLAPRSGGLYVSYTEKDAQTYRTDFVEFLRCTKGLDKFYEYELTAKKDIITPGQKDKVDAFLSVYKNKKTEHLISEMAESKVKSTFFLNIAKRLGHDKTNEKAQEYKRMINSDDPKEKQKAFDDFAKYLFWTHESRKAFINRLEKKGFTAMYDDEDMRGYSDEPLIIFNPAKTLKIESKKEV